MAKLGIGEPQTTGVTATPAATAAWTDTLGAKLSATWSPKGLPKEAVIQLTTEAMLADPAPGVSLSALPRAIAQEILASRAAALKEFFDSWAENIRKNAALDKKAALKRFLEQARETAVERAASELRRVRETPPSPPCDPQRHARPHRRAIPNHRVAACSPEPEPPANDGNRAPRASISLRSRER